MKVSLLVLHAQAFLEPVQRGLHVRHVKMPNRPKGSLWTWGGPCRWHGDTSLHKRSNGVELRDGAQRAGGVGHRLQMTSVKRGDSCGWDDVLREGIYVILAEGRVRKKHGGLAMARVKHGQSFLDGPWRSTGLDVSGQDSCCKGSKPSQTGSRKDGTSGSWEVLRGLALNRAESRCCKNMPRIRSLISLHLFPPPPPSFSFFLSPLFFIVSEAFSIRSFPRSGETALERLRLTWQQHLISID